MKKELTLQMRADEVIRIYAFNKLFTAKFANQSEWETRFQPDINGGLISYTDGFEGTGAEAYGHGQGQKLSFSLDNIPENSNSQATIKALYNYEIKFKLVLDA
jgi:hypothetical protein